MPLPNTFPTVATNDLWTAANHNTYLRDNLNYLDIKVAANIWLSGAGGWASQTLGAGAGGQLEMGTNKQNIKYISFADAAFSYAEWGFAMPDDWDGGTFTAKFHWMHPATTTNFGVAWGLQGRAYANDDALDQAWGTEVVTVDTGGTTSDIYVSPASGAITLAGSPAAGQYVQFRCRRKYDDGSDNMAVAAYLIGIQLTYTRT